MSDSVGRDRSLRDALVTVANAGEDDPTERFTAYAVTYGVVALVTVPSWIALAGAAVMGALVFTSLQLRG